MIAPARAADGDGSTTAPITRLDEAVARRGAPAPLAQGALPAADRAALRLAARGARRARSTRCPTSFPPHVVLGAVPCDAAAVESLDRVMGWDYRDELWFGRREATTIVSVACPCRDESCFCSATGRRPDRHARAPTSSSSRSRAASPSRSSRRRARRSSRPTQARFGRAPNEADVARSRATARRRQPRRADRPARARPRRGSTDHFEDPLWDGRRPPLPRLRRLRLRLPHLPLLRHRRRARGRSRTARAAATGTPARRRTSRSTPRATTRGPTRTPASASA